MEYIKWRNEFSVGNDEIDSQHKKIIDLINDLYDAFVKKNEELETDRVLKELTDYAKNHFKHEEEMFERLGFNLKTEHIKEHKSFIQKVDKMVSDSKANKKLLSMKLTNFLQKWLVNHILEEDSKYKFLFGKTSRLEIVS